MVDEDVSDGHAMLRAVVPVLAHDPHWEAAADLLVGLATWDAAPRSPLARRLARFAPPGRHLLDRVGTLLAWIVPDPVARVNVALARLDPATGTPGADGRAARALRAVRLAPPSLGRTLFLARRAMRGFEGGDPDAGEETIGSYLASAPDRDLALATLVWDALPGRDGAAQAVSLNRYSRLVAEAAASTAALSGADDVASLLDRAGDLASTPRGLSALRARKAAPGSRAEAGAVAIDRLLGSAEGNRLAVARTLQDGAGALRGRPAAA